MTISKEVTVSDESGGFSNVDDCSERGVKKKMEVLHGSSGSSSKDVTNTNDYLFCSV